jgi:uncharacterized protein
MFGTIRNSHGERLDYSVHQGDPNAKQLVVLGHGVTGNKDRPFIVALAEGLAQAGINALCFSFAGNGASEGRFADCTISKEVGDLGAVLDALAGCTVTYAGHSMGGAVGVLRAGRDSRIRQLISLAGMVNTKAFAEREFGALTPGEGFMWDDPACPLSQAYMDDMAQIGSVIHGAPQITVPWLLVHGTEDDVVPIQDSQEIFARANEPKKLVELPGANHVFAGAQTREMVKVVTAWCRQQFGG